MADKANLPDPGKEWIGYREEIKVLDCTIRDGGLMNNHEFSDDVVKACYDACVAGGIDYMELGYKASQRIFAPDSAGKWKFCREDDLRRITDGNPTDLKLSVMCDAERTDYHDDILPVDESVIDLIRVATYIHQIPTAIDMIEDATQKGYETTVNVMAVSAVPDRELDDAIELLANTSVGTIYIVDSFGALYSEQVQALVAKYQSFCGPRGKQVGMHATTSAAWVRQHCRGDRSGSQPPRRHLRRARSRGGQLPTRAADRVPAQPKVRPAADPAVRAGPHRADAQRAQVGLRSAVPADGHVEPAPARRDGLQRGRRTGRHREVLRFADRGRVSSRAAIRKSRQQPPGTARRLFWFGFCLSLLVPSNARAETVAEVLEAVVKQIPNAGAGVYREPDEAEQQAFRTLYETLARRDFEAAEPLAEAVGYRLTTFEDSVTGRRLWLLQEQPPWSRYRGVCLLDPTRALPLGSRLLPALRRALLAAAGAFFGSPPCGVRAAHRPRPPLRQRLGHHARRGRT